MNETSFLGELLKRRVPQIVGLYIAATWMMIEIGDWTIERFSLSPHITSYIFVGMLVFLPSILFLSYQYGRPGYDKWRKSTFVVVPFNLMLSIGAMFYFISPVDATETRIIMDEQGQAKVFEVPKKEFHKNLLNFFWRNETGNADLDWLQYGMPWLLNQDLDRSLFISSGTPITSAPMIKTIRDAGFKNAVKVPRSLKQQIAKTRFYQYTTSGKFEMINDEYKVSVSLHDVIENNIVAQFEFQGKDYFNLLDELSNAIKKELKIPNTLDEQNNNLPIAEHVSESKQAVKLLILALEKIRFERKYTEAQALLEQAVTEDFSFATAYGFLAELQRANGHTQSAYNSLEQALKHEYKLTIQEKFRYKASTYAVNGNFQKQLKILDMWVELYPEDIDAHKSLAQMLTITGLNYQKALNSIKKIRELDPFDDSILRTLSQLHILNNQTEKAAQSLESFINANPQNTDVLIQLANIYERIGHFDKASESLEKVLLLNNNNLDAIITLQKVRTKQGKFELVENTFTQLIQQTQDSEKLLPILIALSDYQIARGEIKKSIETTDAMKKHSAHLPLINIVFQVNFQKAIQLSFIGQFEQTEQIMEAQRELLQPPLNDVLDIGLLNSAILAKNHLEAEFLIEKIHSYFMSYPNPIFESSFNNLKAQLLYAQEKYLESLVLFKKAIKAMSSSIVNTQSADEILQVEVLYARALYKNGDTNQAIEKLKDIITKFPTLAVAHSALAEIYIEIEELDNAEQALEKASEIWLNADQEYYEIIRLNQTKQKYQQVIK